MKGGIQGLSEEDRKALRGSKFAPLPPPRSQSHPPSSSSSLPRIAHPGGPVKTNKAVALAKFLERKLQEPGGLDSLNPELVELAVKNAKDAVKGGTSKRGMSIQHVTSFDDSEDSSSMDEPKRKIHKKEKKPKKVKKKQKNKEKKLKVQNLDC